MNSKTKNIAYFSIFAARGSESLLFDTHNNSSRANSEKQHSRKQTRERRSDWTQILP